MNFIIYDLEATCWNGPVPKDIREVIEIGAYKLDRYGEIMSDFSTFVKPYFNKNLSAYCTELTTITQEQVFRAPSYEAAVEDFIDWIGYYDDEDYLLCSWGDFDKKIFVSNSNLYDMETDWTKFHINLKEQFKEIKRLKKAVGMQKALRIEGFEFEGTEHRAISDAYNLIKIFRNHIDQWRF